MSHSERESETAPSTSTTGKAAPSPRVSARTPAEWMAFRSQMMLDPGTINLNTGSFGPTSRPAFQAAQEYRRQLAEQPMDFFLRKMPGLLRQNRSRLARFLHADEAGLVFVANVTLAMNMVIRSVSRILPAGTDPASVEILITDLEYGCLVWAWEALCEKLGYRLKKVTLPRTPSDPREIVDAVRQAISPATRVLFFSHVTSPTGMVLPAKELCALARSCNIVSMVDGAHAPGFVELDLSAVGADYYGANCHKWLLAPMGSGFLWAKPAALAKLEPLWVSWGYRSQEGIGPHEDDGLGSTPSIRRLEFAGSLDSCAWLAVGTAIDWQEQIGALAIRARQTELIGKVRQTVAAVAPLKEHTPPPGLLGGAMAAFQLPYRGSSQPLRDYLWQHHRMEVNFIERPDEDLLIRFSTHFYNTESEVDSIGRALRDLLAKIAAGF